MNRSTFVILIVCFASIALADDFKTTKGKEYKNATVMRVEADGIVVRTKEGISKLYFAELPDDVQARFGHDPAKIEAEAAAARAAQEKRIEEQKAAEHQRIEEQKAAERQHAETEKNAESDLKRAEQWVVAQVAAGKTADLSEQFPDKQKDKRKLSAHFLEALLTGALSDVKPHRHGVRINGAIIDEPIDLRNAQIPSEVRLEHCQFNASVTFVSAIFAGSVSFESSTFNEDANFNSVKVKGDATFTKAVFECGVNFEGADVASQFSADGAQFNEATFGIMKVGGAAFFNDAVFAGPVIFNSASIADAFVANEAKFLNKEEIASFNNTKVRGNALFSNAVFAGPTNFSLAEIDGQFIADGAQFQNKEQVANFNSMKVRGHTFFNNAVFKGPVKFALADMASNFEADGANFRNEEKKADFHGMKVGGRAFFNNAVFKGPVDFRYSDFAWLDLSRFRRKVAAHFHMQGMSYKYIRAVRKNEPASHKALVKLANQSSYTADVYSNLEEFFLRQGYPADADRAFIDGKHRAWKQIPWSRPAWLGRLLLNLLVGYGRHPWQAMIPCAGLVLIGCFLFADEKMELQKKPEQGEAPRVYNRFWYSLGLFLPFVNLQTSELWKPKNHCTFLRNYVRVHILLGWILVPLVLAALTGLIK